MSHLSGLNSTGQPELKEREREKKRETERGKYIQEKLGGGKSSSRKEKIDLLTSQMSFFPVLPPLFGAKAP